MNQTTPKSFLSSARFAKAVLIAGALFTIGLTQSAMADTTTVVNFDSVDTSAYGYVTGAPVISFLNNYGISFSSTYSNIAPYIEATPSYFGSVSTNLFTTGGQATYYTYTLGFSNPIDSLSFTTPSFGYATMAAWSATAYSADNTVLGSVGNPNLTFSGTAAASYTLSGPAIQYVLFSSDAESWAGTNLTIDSLQFTAPVAPVPEPETYAMLLAGLGLMGFTARRRKNKVA